MASVIVQEGEPCDPICLTSFPFCPICNRTHAKGFVKFNQVSILRPEVTEAIASMIKNEKERQSGEKPSV